MEMDARKMYLSNLNEYIDGVDKEVTMILQSLQWDRKKLLENNATASCKYDAGHRVPLAKLELHEKDCELKFLGYSESDKLLPEPLDPNAKTVVKFSSKDVCNILTNAAQNDPTLRRGEGSTHQPLSLERLQVSYSSDERRAIHDAVVQAVPSSHDLSDLALTSTPGEDNKATTQKSRAEILSELRDMKRRRTKYRVAAKTKNYSDVLRDVIKTQMELYTETQVSKLDHNIDKYSVKNQTNTNTNYKEITTKNNSSDNKHNKYKREHSITETNKHEKHKKYKTDTDYKSIKYADSYNSRNSQMDKKSSYKNDYSERYNNYEDKKDKYKYSDRKYEKDERLDHKDRKRHDYKDVNYRKEKHREQSTSRREYKDDRRRSDSRSSKEEKPRRYYDTNQ